MAAPRGAVSIEFLITSLIVVVSPGTGVLYTLATGLSRGSRASVVAAFGCTLGIVPHMAAAILGLAALLHTSALAFETLKWLFLPQFVDAAEPQPLARMLMLSAVFMLMTFVVFVGYGLFAASIRSHVISRPRVLTWMRRTFAAAFVALGARLALADQATTAGFIR